MHTIDNLAESATAAADPEWLADLLDTMAQGDMDATAEALEGLGRAAAASIRAAFELRARRNEAASCR